MDESQNTTPAPAIYNDEVAEAKPFSWGYNGRWIANSSEGHGYATVSVGIFQWVPRASNLGLRRAGARIRVSGPVHLKTQTLVRAYEIASGFNKVGGIVPAKFPKTITVK